MSKKSVKRRRVPKKQSVMPFAQRDFPKEIIKRLETVASISGRRSGEIFCNSIVAPAQAGAYLRSVQRIAGMSWCGRTMLHRLCFNRTLIWAPACAGATATP